MPHYLVVANQSLIGDLLHREINDRLERGESRFHILVPATPPTEGWTWTEEEARALAKDRLDRLLLRLREVGARAEGEVGDADPYLAIEDSFREQWFDEIIISTYPVRLSSRLKGDLVRRAKSTFNVPVTQVMAPAEDSVRESALSHVPLFAGLSRRRIGALAKASMVAVYKDGRAIIKQGSHGSELFVILDGRAKVVRSGRTVARLSPGDIFGEISLLDGGPRTADVIAEGPTRSLYLSGARFRPALKEDPLLAMRLLQVAGKRLRQLTEPVP
jgi:CRP/FNR family cyclic AMP-dependent transcriptional regulator